MTFDLTAIIGVLIAVFLTPLEGPIPRLVVRFVWVIALVWIALAGVQDVYRDLYGP